MTKKLHEPDIFINQSKVNMQIPELLVPNYNVICK